MSHIVFFDGKCGLCDHVVQWVLKADTKNIFYFAPLQGITAEATLSHLPASIRKADSMVLIENYKTKDQKIYLFGKGVFRTLWLLGGAYKALGWPFFLPSFLYDWLYWIVAKNRKKIFGTIDLPTESGIGRFLP